MPPDVVCLPPRWRELTLFMLANPEITVGHVVQDTRLKEIRALREMFGEKYYPMVPGQSIAGRAFDQIWVDVPLTWSMCEWAATVLLTRLQP